MARTTACHELVGLPPNRQNRGGGKVSCASCHDACCTLLLRPRHRPFLKAKIFSCFQHHAQKSTCDEYLLFPPVVRRIASYLPKGKYEVRPSCSPISRTVPRISAGSWEALFAKIRVMLAHSVNCIKRSLSIKGLARFVRNDQGHPGL